MHMHTHTSTHTHMNARTHAWSLNPHVTYPVRLRRGCAMVSPYMFVTNPYEVSRRD